MYRKGLFIMSVVICAATVSYGQQVRVATPFEGGSGGRGYGGGYVGRNPFSYSRGEIEGMERGRYGREVVDTSHDILRERA